MDKLFSRNALISYLEFIFPFYGAYRADQKINHKNPDLVAKPAPNTFEVAAGWENLQIDDLEKFNERYLLQKASLDDKAKITVFGVSISMGLLINLIGYANSISGSNNFCTLSKLAVSLEAALILLFLAFGGILSLRALSTNIVWEIGIAEVNLKENEKKEILATCCEMNCVINRKRNNYVFSSYRCIINSVVILFIFFLHSSYLGYFQEINIKDNTPKNNSTLASGSSPMPNPSTYSVDIARPIGVVLLYPNNESLKLEIASFSYSANIIASECQNILNFPISQTHGIASITDRSISTSSDTQRK